MSANASSPETAREVFHALHSCGHSVLWTDASVGMGAIAFSCPWCRGESGHIPPLGTTVMRHDPDPYGIRERNPDRTMPPPGQLAAPVVVRHMTDDVYCEAPAPSDPKGSP